MQSSPDIEQASRKLANLSVSQRSPLEEISNKDEEKTRFKHSSHSSCSDQQSFNKSVKTSGSESEHDHQDKIRFNKLVKKAKYLAQDGHIAKALELNRKALAIHYHEKLARRIAKMEEYLKNYGENEEEENDDNMIEVGSGFYLYKELHAKLYSHQKEGVLWLWGLHKKNKGGILGDDMGLGKTIQIIAFLSGLFDMGKMKHALIVVPVSVMVNWEKEFSKWAPGIPVHAFHGNSKRERERALERVRSRGGVLMTTYGMVVTSWEQLASKDGRDFIWDYVILDEGHKIKNPTKTTKGINAVGAKHRIILTGTPIQNNLKELWTLFDYVHQGALLGTLRTFKMEFENPIIRARERDATGGEKRLGMEMANILKKIINPYFLRRTKAQVSEKEKYIAKNDDDSSKRSIRMPTMTYKNDFVVWLFLSDTQVKIYQDFLELDSVKELLMTARSPLVALTVLKKICDHPRLLSLRACHQLGLHGQSINEDELELPSSLESAVTKIEELSDAVLVGEAGKMGVLISLLDQLKGEGHRTLVFSQSRRMLDIIQKVLRNRGHKVLRLDGTITHISERDNRVQKFQEDKSYSVFLLTTQVGGVGLTLTAADRVVIYDPSWNPATDAQAVDRVFRIGQTRNVVVYRLITCGTVEEKIYRRQIFKDSITRQTTGNAQNPYRYFTKQELRELFQLGDTHSSSTQQQLQEMHGEDRRQDPELDKHIAFLYSLNIFGISDHDLMFSQELSHDEEFEDGVMPTMDPHNQEYIQHRVRKAQEIIERESSVPGTMEQRMAVSFPTISSNATSQHHEVSKFPAASKPYHKNDGQSAVSRSIPAASRVQVFIPKPADTQRSMMNRLPEKQKPEPERADIVVKKESLELKGPVKMATENHTSIPIAHTNLSDGNDDVVEVPVAAVPPTVIDLTESDEESNQSGEAITDLPEKTDHKGRQKEATDVPDAMRNLTLEDKISTEQKTLVTPSPPMSHKQPAAGTQQSTTPGRVYQRIVEEELIISPTAYTPLMETRRKRQRMSPTNNSPAAALSRTLAFSSLPSPSPQEEAIHDAGKVPLVVESPETKPSSYSGNSSKGSSYQKAGEEDAGSQDELQSFLSGEDRSCIEESFVGDEDEDQNAGIHLSEAEPLDGVPGTPVHPLGHLSPDVGVGSHRRRSVCRRMARIESSEEEEEEEEDKENIHPAYSSLVQKPEDSRENEQDDNEEESDCVAEDVNEEEEEEEEEAGSGTDPDDGGKEANASVEVLDESVVDPEHEEDENLEAEDEGDDERNSDDGDDERNSDDGDDEPVDIERLQRLLQKGKMLYKQQQYGEAYQYVLEALDIVDDPQLQALAEKIHSKISAGL